MSAKNKSRSKKPTGLSLESALDEAWRCLQCQDPPCEKGCPASVPVRKFIRKIRNFDLRGAALCIRQANVFGASCSRVCATSTQCQRECTRQKMDSPIDIGRLQQFVTDWEREQGIEWEPPQEKRDKKIAIVGAGPAGLSAAAELARLGYSVTVFEKHTEAGGMLAQGIPPLRLPSQIVQREVKAIQRLGVTLKLRNQVASVSQLQKEFDAVVVSTGLNRGVKLGIRGENLPGIHQALELLKAKSRKKKPRLGRRVAVIGGGNTAMDAAAFALQLGAKEVTILYRRSDLEMPAWREEIDRVRSLGISIRTQTVPVAFLGKKKRVSKVRCLVTVAGEEDSSGRRRPIPVENAEFDLEVDDVIVAAGEEIAAGLIAELGLGLKRDGLVDCDAYFSSRRPGVFVAGDLVRFDRTVVQAAADGKAAARSVHSYLGGDRIAKEQAVVIPPGVDLSVVFCGVRLVHPFVLAAAPPTDDLEMLRRGLRAGWAGAVLKTTAIEGEPVELKYPMMAGYDAYGRRAVGLGNIDLISEHHIDVVEKRIRSLKKEFPDRVIVGSMMGSTRQDWETLVRRLEAAGADILECSFSCPQGTLGGEGSFAGQMLGQNVELTREVTSWIKGAAKRAPVVIKITPQVADIAAVARAVREGGADAVCASNTIPSLMGIDLLHYVPQPDVGGKTSFAGMSGPAILPITLRNIALVARHSGLPVAGTGGPTHWKDAVQMMLVGAGYVQFCTAVMVFGFEFVEDLTSGLAWYLKDQGLASPQELIGRTLERIVTHDRLVSTRKVRSRIEQKLCVGCGRCVISCQDGGHQAIDFGKDRKPKVDEQKCVGCGMCQVICPVSGCIHMAVL